LKQGQRSFWQQVRITQQRFGPVNLIGDWSPNQDYPRFWSVDLPANAQAWRRGRKRFWIEPTFRDWKSCGFDLERSKISDPDRLQVLVFGMAATTLWLTHTGDWLICHGHDRLLDRTAHRDYSVFRLGRDHMHRCSAMHWSVPIGFTVTHR
jgi:hypothetical protein